MDNRSVAKILYEVSSLLQMKGQKFQSIAYRKAGAEIESLSEDIIEVYKRGGLMTISGVGNRISDGIIEIIKTGQFRYLEQLRRELPAGVVELSELDGLGPKKAMILSQQLGITSIPELEEAATAGLIRDLPGFGEMSELNLLQSIQRKKCSIGRVLLGLILPVADKIMKELKSHPATCRVSLAGSARRMKETIGDLDILVTSSQPDEIMAFFCSLPEVLQVLARGSTKSSVILLTGLQVDLRVVEEDQFGAALQYFTGSSEHNVALRRLAKSKNLKINEYGIIDRSDGRVVGGKTEEEVYHLLGLPYIEPELRENRGEIEAGQKGNLPEIIPYNSIKGDLHAHTVWSDGRDTISDMAQAMIGLGYEYLAATDHSYSLHITKGLNEQNLADQRMEIERLNRELDGFEVLAGVECNIKSDGSLDINDSALKDLDVVVASVHWGLRMEKREMTDRIVAAMHNDYLDIIGHPTGRIIQKRDPSSFDHQLVFDTAKELGVLLEINAFPSRLDLSDINCRIASSCGVRFSLGSDAHSCDNLKNLQFGIGAARRGWLCEKDIVNTLSLKDLRRVLSQ